MVYSFKKYVSICITINEYNNGDFNHSKGGSLKINSYKYFEKVKKVQKLKLNRYRYIKYFSKSSDRNKIKKVNKIHKKIMKTKTKDFLFLLALEQYISFFLKPSLTFYTTQQ